MAGNGGIIGPDIVISNSIASPSPIKDFTSTGTYSSPSTVFAIDYLVVAGGGGGGADAGGAGRGAGKNPSFDCPFFCGARADLADLLACHSLSLPPPPSSREASQAQPGLALLDSPFERRMALTTTSLQE